MNTPLVSVVIPTINRPQYLPRAVESALMCQGEDVEVIVVPNGPDESWRKSLVRWASDPRVIVLPIENAHGNAARNHGMVHARGKYLRFLDDDDYLLPPALQQLETINGHGADFCSGLLANVDQDGVVLGQVAFPETRDFLCAAVSVSGFTLPTGNLYDRKALGKCLWDVNVQRLQDNAWMIDLAAEREWHWVHLDQQVGVWFQHSLTRTSNMKRSRSREEAVVQRLLALHNRIVCDGRDNTERSEAIAQGLWYYIHLGFPYHPFHWGRIARIAHALDPRTRPLDPFYRTGPFRLLNPVISEWLLFLPRRVTRAVRDTKNLWRDNDYRRRL